MRVSLINQSDGYITGLSRYSENLYRKLIDHNVDVKLDHPKFPLHKLTIPVGKAMGWDLQTFFQSYPLGNYFERADIHHFTNETLATSLAFRPPIRSVVTVHAFFTYLLRRVPELSMYNHVVDRLFDNLVVKGLFKADAIIAVSHYVKEALIKDLGLPSQRIYVIPEAVDHLTFRPQHVPKSFRDKYGLLENKRYLLYVGSEQPRKNFITLLKAFASIADKIPDVDLIKVGNPEASIERKKAIQLINDLCLQNRVRFFQHASTELPLFYNVADIFVFPSRYEGFGFPPLEAMACGTAVICSNATSLPEVTQNSALQFSPLDINNLQDSIYWLLTQESARQEYIKLGLANAKRFHWDKCVQETILVYKDLLSK